MKVFERFRWGARPAAHAYDINPLPREMFVHHSAGRGAGIETLAEQSAAMRAIQDYHMDHNGWSDIGYHLVVFQPYGLLRRARVFRARPPGAIPAAQLNHNSGTLAVCVVGDREKVKPATKRLLKQIYRESTCLTVRGHFEVYATECPGAELRAFLPELKKVKP